MEDDLSALVAAASALAGQDGYVPTRLEKPDMPERAAVVQRAISGTARLSTLRWLTGNPESTRAEIAAGSALPSGTVRVALYELEELGYVTLNVHGQRHGRLIRYSVRRDQLAADLDVFTAWLLQAVDQPRGVVEESHHNPDV